MGILKKLFGARPPRETFDDPVLGRLRPGDDGDYWETSAEGETIGFELGGDEKPADVLLSHARDLLRDTAASKRKISDFLKEEKANFPAQYHGEIDSLTIDQVCLSWPERPNDGMIYFNGPSEARLWRCDYIARQPKGLGFDS